MGQTQITPLVDQREILEVQHQISQVSYGYINAYFDILAFELKNISVLQQHIQRLVILNKNEI
jgi:hypothetical protein